MPSANPSGIPLGGDPEGSSLGLEARFSVKAGARVVTVAFEDRTFEYEGYGPSRLPVGSTAHALTFRTDITNGKLWMGVESVQIEGPFNGKTPQASPSRERIFVCRPARSAEEHACARTILSTLARRAYRRPITPEDLQTLLGFYTAGRREGSFDRGIQTALERMLSDPSFLFRVERDPGNLPRGAVYRIRDVELASRLSFFLWSSVPDETLLDLAVRGRLKDAAVLEQQVRRMLRDSRSKALVDNFFGQWLYLRNMATVKPDPSAFPDFDDSLRQAFQRETELFLADQLRDDHSALDLLTADYTFANERLARHYGIPNVYGSHFRRVPLNDGARAGLLGHGSILTVTSYANRTSPVIRGKWLLENILGSPPPAPPPNVPVLKEEEKGVVPTSMRERMAQHRKNPVCANCHSTLDPLGFALEVFDAVGQWRSRYGDTPVDPSGSMPDGTKFSGPAEFRRALLTHREEFVRTLSEKLLTYAMGRGVESFDMPAVRAIVNQTASKEFRWSALISAIVNSRPFLMRSTES